VKNRDFRPIYGFISKTIQYSAEVTVKHQSELVRDLSNGAFSVTLSDP